ncbi:Carboxymuconolactone decarboxylase family protein [Pelagimonas phthalicica]|uniref:Carboxymuconolactone decarboxylase family protein n=1 Tax=Pelagimonas phthalicica TaxID=1037362 RepID=A0A238JHF3_9RHOB|nr:carboxymuconolactone decarboxylase family protein [Pelagimonas phthalicica]TDS89922.1 AhpD family alkylhydroperoxidase [Pelagimonas phthalicica]SMX30089.1 Carboxymuconolactone decarboxylase family protein [Pelagimonas phthalicica]
MTTTYNDRATEIDKRVGALFKATPSVMTSYSQLVKAASADGALDSKTKELMAFAISIAIRCEDCIVFHLRAALKHGASQEEVIEAISVAVEMGGGPSVVYGGRALKALEDLA